MSFGADYSKDKSSVCKRGCHKLQIMINLSVEFKIWKSYFMLYKNASVLKKDQPHVAIDLDLYDPLIKMVVYYCKTVRFVYVKILRFLQNS